MRAVDYVAIGLKDLRRQPVRSGLTMVALVISTVIVTTLAAISIGGRQAITDQFGTDDALAVVTVTPNQGGGALSPFGGVQQVNAGASKLDDAAAARLAKIPHVKAAEPRAHVWEFRDFSLAGNDKNFVAQAEGVPADGRLPLAAGTQFAPGEEQHAVIVGFAYAKALGLGDSPEKLVGKTVTITTQKGYRGAGADIPGADASRQENEAFNQAETKLPAKIIGVTREGPEQNGLFLPLEWARDIRTARFESAEGLKKTDQLAADGYTSVKLTADAKGNVAAVTKAVEAMGYGQISTLAQIERVQQFSAVMWIVLGAVAAIAAVAAALGVVNTMLMAVSEQRFVIGVWRACGARKGTIVTLFLVEAALLGLLGGALGVGAGALASRFINQYVNSLLKAQNLALTDIAALPLWLLFGAAALTVAFSMAAGLYPAFRAAREDPSRALGDAR